MDLQWEDQYRYEYGSRQYLAASDDPTFGSLQLGQQVPVLIAPWLPNWGSMIDPEGAVLHVDWTGALLWNSFMAMIPYMFVVMPYMKRRLLVNGNVAVGTVERKLGSSGGTFMLEFEFVPMSKNSIELPPVKGLVAVNEREWNSVNIGDQMTILYNPKNPLRCLIYQFYPYKVAKAGP